MKKQQFKLKNDRYRKARGGYARFLNIYCAHCKSPLLLYQKDGSGPLKRLYLDRITAPDDARKTKKLTCRSCKNLIGTFYLYEKEKRPAFRLYQDAVIKKVGNGVYPLKSV